MATPVMYHEKLENILMERDGNAEAITVLEAYIEEIYKKESEYTTPRGLLMVLDKLKDRAQLIASEYAWLTKMVDKRDTTE